VNSLLQAPAVVVAVLTWLSATPTSLADAARREALRRQLTAESVQVLTNQDLPPAPARAAVQMPVLEAQPETPGAASPAGGQAVGAPAPETTAAQPQERRDEAWWRARMTTAQESLERDRVLAEAMQSRINALQADVVNRDDPAQQAQLRQQLQRALDELDRLNRQIAAGEQAIRDIQTEARRQRVPPGWLR
jgi:hypothetical protein